MRGSVAERFPNDATAGWEALVALGFRVFFWILYGFIGFHVVL